MTKKLVYVAHPYGGKESNKNKIDKIMNELVLNDSTHDYVSPIHNYGFMYLTGDEYQRRLDICIGLLSHCDVLVLCEDWEHSRGCRGELDHAKKNGKAIFMLDEWKGINGWQ
jgi:hypothetical protein